MSASDLLELESVTAAWEGTPVVREVTFSVGRGETLVLMGPNGGGKTTLLRVIAGLERPASGAIRLDGRSILDVPVHRRGIGMLFQEPALFPHRSVEENIAYGLEIARRPSAFVTSRVRELSQLLRLDALLGRRPDELSGGEQQRVALARTLAPGPALVLLDEPFASVDPELRHALAAEFRSVLRDLGTTAIFVTHDREEGLFLGDRVALLFAGRLVQLGSPTDVFNRPATAAVARFLGYNVLPGPSGAVAVLPSQILLGPPDPGALAATVIGSGVVGESTMTHLTTAAGERVAAIGASNEPARPAGQRVAIRWKRSVELPSGPDG
ncbi:MAG: ABC transporter ATP-binding protein [Thermoplasmata archaeon]|nr:ABC transporter ATP-binding protein [Thermoplasmata archaeon]